MLDLFSINEIKPIKEDIRCRGCSTFNAILHASDVWILKDDEFIRMEPREITSCLLIEKICAGSILRQDDYDKIDSCDEYVVSESWNGMNKPFIVLVNAIVDYLFLTDGLKVTREEVMEISEKLESKVAVCDRLNDKPNIDNQFYLEFINYNLMESVRRLMMGVA